MTTATLHTSEGPVELELFPNEAPKTVENFDEARAGTASTTGSSFHRVIPDFMIQGGCPQGTGTGGPGYTFEDEFNEHKVDRGRARDGELGSRPRTAASSSSSPPTRRRGSTASTRSSARSRSGQDVVDRISQADRDARDMPKSEITIDKVDLSD